MEFWDPSLDKPFKLAKPGSCMEDSRLIMGDGCIPTHRTYFKHYRPFFLIGSDCE